jgi:hypothetical protein
MEEFPATQRSCRLMTTEAKDLHLQLRSRGGVHFIFSFCRDGCVPGKLCFMLCVHGASVLEKRLMVIGSVRLFFFLKQCNELEMNLKSLVFNSRTWCCLNPKTGITSTIAQYKNDLYFGILRWNPACYFVSVVVQGKLGERKGKSPHRTTPPVWKKKICTKSFRVTNISVEFSQHKKVLQAVAGSLLHDSKAVNCSFFSFAR